MVGVPSSTNLGSEDERMPSPSILTRRALAARRASRCFGSFFNALSYALLASLNILRFIGCADSPIACFASPTNFHVFAWAAASPCSAHAPLRLSSAASLSPASICFSTSSHVSFRALGIINRRQASH